MAEASDARVACPHCGKQYRWKPDLAGRKVVCKCGQKMRLPATVEGRIEPLGPPPPPADPNEASTYDLEVPDEPAPPEASAPSESPESPEPAATAARPSATSGASRSAGSSAASPPPSKCPSCNQPLKRGAVLCVNCGYNLESGQQLETAVVEAPEADEAEDATPTDTDTDAAAAATSPLTAMGSPSAVSRALEDRLDEAHASPFIELYLPLGLIVLGVLMRFLEAMYFGDNAADSFLAAAVATGVNVAISIPLLLLGLLVSVNLLGVSFGPLGPALFKLLAILLGPAALGDMAYYLVAGLLDSGFTGAVASFFATIAIMWALLSKLFNLESIDALYVLIIMHMVNFLVTVIVGFFVLGILFA